MIKLYTDTEKELTFDDYKPLPSLRGLSLQALYELQSNLEEAIDNAVIYHSELLEMALDMDLRKIDMYVRMKQKKQEKKG